MSSLVAMFARNAQARERSALTRGFSMGKSAGRAVVDDLQRELLSGKLGPDQLSSEFRERLPLTIKEYLLGGE